MSRRGCYMSVDFSKSYNRCPTCGFVRRSWWSNPLIHKGRNTMSDAVGYVVIEYNQASNQPSLAWKVPHLLDTAEDAAEFADKLTSEARSVGRKETYAIGTVTIEED